MKVKLIDIVNFYKKHPDKIKDILVHTPYGLHEIEAASQTDFSVPLKIITSSGLFVICSKKHRFKSINEKWIYADELKIGTWLQTRNGFEQVKIIEEQKEAIPLYDIQVANVQQYFSNGIVSHNSSILDMILFCLFDRLSRDVNKSSIPNRRYKKNCVVELWLRTGDKYYYIKNSISPTNFELWESDGPINDDLSNCRNISKGSSKETLKYIHQNIIRTSYKIFTNTNILSVTDHSSIYSMSKNDKRKFTESLFSISLIGDIYKDITTELNKIESLILQGQQNVSQIEKRIVDLQHRHESFQDEKKKKIDGIYQLICRKEEEILKVDDGLVDEKKRQQENKKELNELQHSLVNEERTLRDEEREITNEITRLSSLISRNKTLIDTYKKTFDNVCGDCRARLKGVLNVDIDSLIESSKNTTETISKMNGDLSEVRGIVLEVLEELTNIREKLRGNESVLFSLNKREQMLSQMKSEVRSLEDSLVTEDERVSQFGDLVEKEKRELDTILYQLEIHEERLKYLDALKCVYNEQGVKNFVIGPLIKTLNNIIQEYLVLMGSEYTVLIDPTFNFKFITVSGECEYGNFSAGERRRIDIATIFALRDLLMMKGMLECNILVCDEILDVSIDNHCMNVLLDKLKEISEHQNVFLISHREVNEESGMFDTIVRIEKTHGCTHIGLDTSL